MGAGWCCVEERKKDVPALATSGQLLLEIRHQACCTWWVKTISAWEYGEKKMMMTTHVPTVTIPYPSVLTAGHGGQASWHGPVKSTFFLQAAKGTWPCVCHQLSGAYGPTVCAFAWCKNSKSSDWVVSWALGELGRCTKYSAFCFIMNYSAYLEQREFSLLVFSLQFVPSLLVGVCWNLCFLLMRSSTLIRSKKNCVL